MGNPLEIVFVFNYKLDFSNVISILAIIVNFILAIWIVKTIQNKLTNRRVLKDHFISEIKDLRAEYNEYIKDFYAGRVIPQETLRWFKLLDIKKTYLMADICSIYKITVPNLDSFHADLRELVTNSQEYSTNYRSNLPVVFTSSTKGKLDRIQGRYNGIFNKLVILINDSN